MPASDYVLDAIKDESMLEELTTYAIDYAHSVGFVGLCSDRKDALDLTITPPMTLLPSPFPLELFEKAISVQETLNELYFRISMDHDFLVDAYKNVVKADKWVAKQVEMMKRVHAEGIRQKYVLQVQRVDYMAHRGGEEKIELKQIEVNLGPGGPGFAQKMAKVHKKLLQKVENLHYGPIPGLTNATIPARRSIAEALFNAWKLQGDPEAYIVFVFDSSLYPIQHHEQCQFVQFELENAAKKEKFPINVIRMTFEECAKRMHLDSEGDYSLLIDGDKRVSLVYMVYGYLPEHYATEKEWNCLLDMERSTAIVSPNIRLQLTGTKKIQQILAKPGVIETFLPDISHKKIAQLRSTFTGIWALDGDSKETKALIEDAIQNPQNYVLKALRDDGIGNFFDEELAEMLQEMSVHDRSAFILQEKIRPIIVKNYTKRPFIPAQLENVVTELGIFGTCIHSAENGDGKTLWNRVDASVSKTKGHNFNQGGIGEGSGVIDSLVLLPKADFSLTKD